MRKLIKYLASLLLIPATRWYLQKERSYRYRDIFVTILPGVFHPGLFGSTKFLLSFLEHQDLKEKKFLEVGSGSGIVSISAAKQNADVTALDLSKEAVATTKLNASKNAVGITVIHSDLFDELKKEKFDWIAINPPYYAQHPANDEELAWYCGENFEYFRKLFRSLPDFIDEKTHVIMVLTKGCDLEKIFTIASEFGFRFRMIEEKKVFFDERNFLFSIERIS